MTAAPKLPDWSQARYADALARRDVLAIFGYLVEQGWTQRRIAFELGSMQSEISDIMKGRRKPIKVNFFEKVAKSFHIPPGKMGLAWSDSTKQYQGAEAPDMLEHAIKAMIGESSYERSSYLLDPTPSYSHIGKADATAANEYFLAIQRIEQQYSGQLLPAQALIRQTGQMLKSEMTDDVRTRLTQMQGWMNSFAGWCAIDSGNFDLGMSHFSEALNIAGSVNDHLGKCRALYSAGKAELHYGDPEQALKLFQFGVIPADAVGSQLFQAGFAAHSAWAVSLLDPSHVARYTEHTWESYGLMKPQNEREQMEKFVTPTDLLAVTGQAQVLSAPEKAIKDLRLALRKRPASTRSTAFETATLAHAYLAAGYTDKALETGRKALKLVKSVRSKRVAVRLKPLKVAAYTHGSSAMTELAEDIRKAS